MSAAGIVRPSLWQSFPIDLSWRNLVFALRTGVAGVTALAIAYWLEMQDPQWAILTVYLLAQPTSGAALAKGIYRIFGTLLGATVGLAILALYSQAGPPLVGSVALWMGLCFYVGARLTNYAAYGFMMAGYTTLLVALEGSADPTSAWSIAADRTGEIVIGIVCITAVSTLIFPRYAGVVLRSEMAGLFARLCHYGATALQPGTPQGVFAQMRRSMIEAVVKFDALRSYTMFEAPELRADDVLLRRSIREFLRVLAVARGLYVRLEAFHVDGAAAIVARTKPALAETSALLERIATDPRAFDEPRRVRGELLGARTRLDAAAAELQAMAGHAPFDPLANGLLVLRRAGDLLHGLSMVMVSESASLRARRPGATTRSPAQALPAAARKEAVLVALRAIVAVALACALWAATEWNDGFVFVSGAALILFFSVNQDRPGKIAFSFLIWSVLAIGIAYVAMVVVLPRLEGYEALALFLIVLMFPGGLMAGTPQYAWPGIALAGFIGDQIGTGNVFSPSELTFVNSNIAFVAGMGTCLLFVAVCPVTSLATRSRVWEAVIGRLLPEAARGERHERRILGEIIDLLAALLPRLSLDRPGEEDFLRGTLGCASTSLELGRLNRLTRDPDLPAATRDIISAFLTDFAAKLEELPHAGGRRLDVAAQAEDVTRRAYGELAARPLEPGSAGAELTLRAGASLRFVCDRFDIDRAFLLRSFAEE